MSGAFLLIGLAVYLALVVPAYVIGQRIGVKQSWGAFIPFLGTWAILFGSVGRSGWYALFAFVPYLGGLVCVIWLAIEIPMRHERSQLWTLAFLVPGFNVIAYWWYAFTLEEQRESLAFA